MARWAQGSGQRTCNACLGVRQRGPLLLRRTGLCALRLNLMQMHSHHTNLDVHEWSGTFRGRPARFKMTRCAQVALSHLAAADPCRPTPPATFRPHCTAPSLSLLS